MAIAAHTSPDVWAMLAKVASSMAQQVKVISQTSPFLGLPFWVEILGKERKKLNKTKQHNSIINCAYPSHVGPIVHLFEVNGKGGKLYGVTTRVAQATQQNEEGWNP